MEQMNLSLKLLDVDVPTDVSHPEGMQVVFGDREDKYMANYYPDIEYVKYGERALRLNLIKPTFQLDPAPLLIFIQGSAWLPQQRYEAIPQLSDFAHQGYVVASVEYRHSLEAKFPAQIQDVLTAIRFLKANAQQFQIDPNRVAVWGDSSGGHLSSLVGMSEGVDAFMNEHYMDQSNDVRAVINFCGPSDLLQLSKFPSLMNHDEADSPASLLIGGPIQENRDKAAAANPINYIDSAKPLPPFLIMHGDRDELIPFQQSVLLYEALRDAGQDVTFYKVKGASHRMGLWNPTVFKVVSDFLKANLSLHPNTFR
ncbi:alpha/beta hydrolase fold domain-containing protein [Paenibacillus sp. GCM10027628]|uniref:alpha/beta hydrolase fold domain-containing protein n=1 Tax=Paenibacillus sp. GCM10027628 TaxID=3273413 RepID=UPI00362995D6